MPLWCTVMPITTFLLIPSVQGTIPPYLLAFASAMLVLTSGETGWFESQRSRYLGAALLLAGIWLLLFCGSQLGHLVSNRHDFGDLHLIRNDDRRVLFRPAVFTQTLYLAACVCTALFFRFFFREEWMRYVLWGLGSWRSTEFTNGYSFWSSSNRGTLLGTGCTEITLEAGPREYRSDLAPFCALNRPLENPLGFQRSLFPISSSPCNTRESCFLRRYFFASSFPRRLPHISLSHSHLFFMASLREE